MTISPGVSRLEQDTPIRALSDFDPTSFHHDIVGSGGHIINWEYGVPIPEFHAPHGVLDAYPRFWTDNQTKAWLLRALHPLEEDRTRFVKTMQSEFFSDRCR